MRRWRPLRAIWQWLADLREIDDDIADHKGESGRKLELGRIREIRGDVYTGPAARLIPEIADNRPWPTTPKLDKELRHLSDGELMAAIDLGILTLDLLVQKERDRLTEAKKTCGKEPPRADVISLLSKVIGSD